MPAETSTGNGANCLQAPEKPNPDTGVKRPLVHVADLKERLDVVSRLGAVLVVLLYVCGFLVVSFQNASHGIVTFGLFRARVLAAGVLFTFFLSLALLDWARFFGANPAKKDGSQAFGGTFGEFVRSVLPRLFGTWLYLFLRRAFWFVAAALGLTFILSPVVFHGETAGVALVLYVCFVAVGTAMTIPSKISKHAVLSSLIHVLILAGAVAGLGALHNWDALLMLGWFAIVGFTADFIKSEILGKSLRDLKGIRDIRWAWIVVFAIGVCSYFGDGLYPRIQPTIGGGQPIKAIFQFAGKSPIDGSAEDELWLLDEEDTGYYVLRTPTERNAVFVPRSVVAAIYYDAREPDPRQAR